MTFHHPLMRCVAILAVCIAATRSLAGTRVDFRPDGICQIDGKPFFPIGVWLYGLDTSIIADVEEHHFNTVLGSGFSPDHMPLVEKHGLMCIPQTTDAFLEAAKDSPSLLGWYLADEPEEHNMDVQTLRDEYHAWKAKDASHPVGVSHDFGDGESRYPGCNDFTMSDVYPVTKDRDWPLGAVGKYTDGSRDVHGKGWPNFTIVQTFGGPDTDGGKWSQPLPHEVRFMVMDALVHRANGIFYFSYWPKAPLTWASITDLNKDIERLVPWLLAEGDEGRATSSEAQVEIRAKRVGDGNWMILVANTEAKPVETELKVEGLGSTVISSPFERRDVRTHGPGAWWERLGAHETRAYVVGEEPKMKR